MKDFISMIKNDKIHIIIFCVLLFSISFLFGYNIGKRQAKLIQTIDKINNNKRILIIQDPNTINKYALYMTSFDNSIETKIELLMDELKIIRDDIIKVIPLENEVKK